jgi:hypothetical protein
MTCFATQEKTSLQQIQTEHESAIDDLIGKLPGIAERNVTMAETEIQCELVLSKDRKMTWRYTRLFVDVRSRDE